MVVSCAQSGILLISLAEGWFLLRPRNLSIQLRTCMMQMETLMNSGAMSFKKIPMSSSTLSYCFLCSGSALSALSSGSALFCLNVFVISLLYCYLAYLTTCYQLWDPKTDVYISPAREFFVNSVLALVSLLQGSSPQDFMFKCHCIGKFSGFGLL